MSKTSNTAKVVQTPLMRGIRLTDQEWKNCKSMAKQFGCVAKTGNPSVSCLFRKIARKEIVLSEKGSK